MYKLQKIDLTKRANTWSLSQTFQGDLVMQADITLRDNDKIVLGDGSDAEVYYDGTNLVINPKAVGSGDVRVNGVLRVRDDVFTAGFNMGRGAQSTSSVSTSATTILTEASNRGVLVFVFGDDASNNRFMDMVFFSAAEDPSVAHSFDANGTVPGRTYTRSSTNLQLAMASGTFDIAALAFGTAAP